ncbi:hypothetical protein IMZ48_29330 [Candidatus Bathyarchaeota archaeon]|nr:hypothetical protein [Candidatus Bathyarchaeota archaeon]
MHTSQGSTRRGWIGVGISTPVPGGRLGSLDYKLKTKQPVRGYRGPLRSLLCPDNLGSARPVSGLSNFTDTPAPRTARRPRSWKSDQRRVDSAEPQDVIKYYLIANKDGLGGC